MKVITKFVIDIETLEVVDEESYEYEGPVAECKSGGGSSGKISYPAYMQDVHSDWLSQGGVDLISSSMTDIMNAAIGHSPWATASAYAPDVYLNAYATAISDFHIILSGLSDSADWKGFYADTQLSIGSPTTLSISNITVGDMTAIGDVSAGNMSVSDRTLTDISIPDRSISDISGISDISVADADKLTDAEIQTDIDAFADQLDDEITTKVLPRFDSGMRDINAVVSSAFVIGESIIEAFRDRDVAKYASGLRVAAQMKNADISLANNEKDVRIGLGNLEKNINIARSNLDKDTRLGIANLEKDVRIGNVNLDKDMRLSISNLEKDTQVGRTNVDKDVRISIANLDKNLQIGKSNLTKNTEVGLGNLKKDIQVGSVNISAETNYVRAYLEGVGQIENAELHRITFESEYVRTLIEANRIAIVAKKEENDYNLKIDENDATWDLEVFQYGANLLASVSGGTSGAKGPSMVSSTIGGALSGAAAGAMIGSVVPGLGTVTGAIAGGILGGASGLLS